MEDSRDTAERLGEALRTTESSIPTSRIGRLWRMGRTAAAMGTSVLGARLRGDATAESEDLVKFVQRLGELRGVAMKAGQIMSYVDAAMPEQARAVLGVLQTRAPASPWSAVEATLRGAWGDRADVMLARMERVPFAVASIGQVHRGRLPDGTEVVIKVRHEGIADAMENDFRTASVGSSFARVVMPGSAETVKGVIDEARTAMLEECDFSLEASRQSDFRRRYERHPDVVIPEVMHAWCSASVLVTAYTPGKSLDAFLAENPSQAVRDRAGVALFTFALGSLYVHGLFHADPHPGNFAFYDDGRVILYDFGCVRTFPSDVVDAMAKLVKAVRVDDREQLRSGLLGIGAVVPDEETLSATRLMLRGLFAPLIVQGPQRVEPGAAVQARELLADKKMLAKLALPGRLLFLFRLRFGLYSVLARLGSCADWSSLESGWAGQRVQQTRLESAVSARAEMSQAH